MDERHVTQEDDAKGGDGASKYEMLYSGTEAMGGVTEDGGGEFGVGRVKDLFHS
jgi:hypothetical protein